jgi:acetyl-CoA carboxylase biotin carboxyl carrier protein
MWKIEAAIGDVVEEEQQVAIIESMKMEIPVIAPVAGTVVEILVKEGDPIAEEQPVLVIET